MTRDEIIKEYEAAVAAHAAAAVAGIKGAGKSYELFKAGLDALRPVSREQMEKVWRGEWIWDTIGLYPKPVCSKCGEEPYRRSNHTSDLPNYCPKCGAPMTDKAVQMVMERMDKCINLT